MIERKEWFTIRETMSPNEFIIVPKDYDTFPMNAKTGGSYGIAPARVLGLTYPNYLRFLMQMFPNDVTVRGKNHLYPVAYWKKDKTLYTFVRMLNRKMDLALGTLEGTDEQPINNTAIMSEI